MDSGKIGQSSDLKYNEKVVLSRSFGKCITNCSLSLSLCMSVCVCVSFCHLFLSPSVSLFPSVSFSLPSPFLYLFLNLFLAVSFCLSLSHSVFLSVQKDSLTERQIDGRMNQKTDGEKDLQTNRRDIWTYRHIDRMNRYTDRQTMSLNYQPQPVFKTKIVCVLYNHDRLRSLSIWVTFYHLISDLLYENKL
jgi:hypothetical protein